MLITALRRTASDRFTVVLADGSEIESSLGVVTDLRLFTGKDLEEEEGFEGLLRGYRVFWRVLRPFPMVQYKIIDGMIPGFMRYRKKLREKE